MSSGKAIVPLVVILAQAARSAFSDLMLKAGTAEQPKPLFMGKGAANQAVIPAPAVKRAGI